MIAVLDYLFELFKIIIPSIAVVVTVQIMLKNHFDDVKTRDRLAMSRENKKDLRPLQMQAYERIILFLERLQLDNLMMRMQKPNMTSRALHTAMLRAIRQEYEHNMTQQLYISPEAWKLTLMAKEEMIKLINLSASNLPAEATAMDLGTQMMNVLSKLDKIPVDVAINGVKQEFQSKFGK